MKGTSLLITQLLLLNQSSALSTQETITKFDKNAIQARNRLNEEEQKNFDMFDILSDKLTDSSYIHSLVEHKAKYDESDENPDYYGLGNPKQALPIIKVAQANATNSHILANTKAVVEAEAKAESEHHHKRHHRKSRIKGGEMV